MVQTRRSKRKSNQAGGSAPKLARKKKKSDSTCVEFLGTKKTGIDVHASAEQSTLATDPSDVIVEDSGTGVTDNGAPDNGGEVGDCGDEEKEDETASDENRDEEKEKEATGSDESRDEENEKDGTGSDENRDEEKRDGTGSEENRDDGSDEDNVDGECSNHEKGKEDEESEDDEEEETEGRTQENEFSKEVEEGAVGRDNGNLVNATESEDSEGEKVKD